MSDQEKYEQVGKLAEEVSRFRGELNHTNEKLLRAYGAYQRMGQSQGPNTWTVQNGKIEVTAPYTQPQPADLLGLLSAHELTEILEHRQKLTGEMNAVLERLKKLAPNLF